MRTRAGRGLRLLVAVLLALGSAAIPAAAAHAAAIDTTSDMAAVSWGPGRVDLFARGVDGTLEHKYYNGRWSQWQSLGGVIVGAPAASTWGAGRIDVFTRGTDNAVHHMSFSSNTWSAWESLGGATNAAPAAASWGANRIDVFVRGTNNAMYHKWFTGGAWSASWEADGGTFSTAPAVAAWGVNRLDVFGAGTSGAMYHRAWNGSAWSGWVSMGGSVHSAPSVASWASGRLDVFYRGSDNSLQHMYYAGSWKSDALGGTMSGAPAAISDTTNQINVYYRNGTALTEKIYRAAWKPVSIIDETPGNVPPAPYTPTVGLQGAPPSGALVGPLWFGYVDNVGRVVIGQQSDPDNVQSVVWTVMSGNEAFSGPPAVLSQPNGLTLVVAQHASSDVWTLTQKTAQPPTWGAWLSQGGSMASKPVPARMPDGSFVLFATDATGELWALPQSGPNGTFGAWKPLGGPGLVAGSLSMAALSGGVQVFGVTASGSVQTAEYFSSGTMSAWTDLAGSGLTGTPAVVVYPGYALRVFVRGADGVLVTKKSDGAGTWESAWSPVGTQAFAGSPAAVLSPTSGKTEVVARDANGDVWNTGETTQGSGVWRGWVNVTNGGDVAATDPSIVTFTGSSGATWEFVFRNADQQNRVYTVGTQGGAAAAQNPGFAQATLPKAPSS